MAGFFKKSLILGILLLCLLNKSYATHAIGGDLHVEWTGYGTIYRITLNMYVNDKSVDTYQLGVDAFQEVYFSTTLARSNYQTYINQVSLPLVYKNVIATNNNYCATTDVVQTSLISYSREVDLSTILYSSQPYYITWQYGYRNLAITNLVDPISTYIALYVQCPSLYSYNSSPKFKPLKNEFFCKNKFNTYDLSAIDSDGDSLVYSIVSPLGSIEPLYYTSNVNWKPGYSGLNPIPGSMPLTIGLNTGLIAFNPSEIGVYCFGIKVEEYRNRVKIGEVRKDYQFNVQDCPINNKPKISFVDSSIKENDTLTVQLNGSACFPMYITDIDATQYFISETIVLNASFGKSTNSALSAYPQAGISIPNQVNLSGFRDTTRFDACFNPCQAGLRLDETAYYPFKIIINDTRCPAKYDTLLVTIKVETQNNNLPEIVIDPYLNPKRVVVDEILEFVVRATDADVADKLSLTLLNPQRNVVFENVKDSMSTISSPFTWQPICNDLNPGVYEFIFQVSDNTCRVNTTNTITQVVIVEDKEVSFDGFNITNLITPNGDGLNDCYRIEGIPLGNCSKFFNGIEIYNRWGSRVFYSLNKDFSWCPEESDGMYYYAVDLNYEVRKGWLQITR